MAREERPAPGNGATPLERHLRSVRAGGRKILSVYVTAGLPTPGRLPSLVAEIGRAGADIVELGVPFSDPVADGLVIQEGSARALREGVTPASVLAMAAEIRNCSDVPVILMGYANPFLSHGLDAFIRDAARAGVAGMIVPDLPPDEAGSFLSSSSAAGIASILLVSPTTPPGRVAAIDGISSGFVYCVSTLGVTGERRNPTPDTLEYVERTARLVTRRPLLAGFGVSGPDAAAALASRCDGVIVGSAVVSRILAGADPVPFVNDIRRALDSSEG